MIRFCALLISSAIAVQPVFAQDVVPVGKGSYASSPPPQAGKDALAMVGERQPNVVDLGDRPVPTNQWWTHLLTNKATGQLWSYPLCAESDAEGLNVFFPSEWNPEGQELVRDFPVRIRGANFKPAGVKAMHWGDWTLQFRLEASAEQSLDVTLGRGMPYVWVECRGVDPVLRLEPAPQGPVAFFDAGGNALSLPQAGDAVGFEYAGRAYGLFAPDGTQFDAAPEGITVRFAGDARYLVLAALPKKSDFALLRAHAFAVPRDSRLSWKYDPAAAIVAATFDVRTEPLKGDERRVVQGLLPHHLRTTKHKLALNDLSYVTPRGTMRAAVGSSFELTYRFDGTLASLPAPRKNDLPNDYDADRMRDYVARYATKSEYGAETYWGGKDLVYFGQYLDFAKQLGDRESAEKLRTSLARALGDWLTYTPGEAEHYFTCYPNWRGLVGLKGSYGSEQFTDNHFHYGYFTYAAALLAMHDAEFLTGYGEMLKLVAKQYANPDRDDKRFPFLRTFDAWAGHSHAAGLSSPRGNNQESTSEAMQSWGGLFLLGSMLGDDAMRDTGAMGYAMESQATLEYWLNKPGENLPANYKQSVVGILFDGGNAYATYFTADPAWIHAIQWLPISPILSYLAEDPDFARKAYERMFAERVPKESDNSISGMKAALGNVVLGFAALSDPDAVARQMDDLWAAGDPVARDNYTPGITYYYTHVLRRLGTPVAGRRMSVPTSRVYRNARTGTLSYVVYNPRPYPQWAEAWEGDTRLGGLLVPPRTLVCEEKLQPLPTAPTLLGAWPAEGSADVSRLTKKIYLTFSEPIDATTISAIRLDGRIAGEVRVYPLFNPAVVALAPAGALEPGETYKITIPATVKTAAGAAAVGEDRTLTFTVEPQPLLAIVATDPADKQNRVAADLKEVRVWFNAPIDPATLAALTLGGPGVSGVEASVSPDDPTKVTLKLTGAIEPDGAYTLSVSPALKSVRGDALAAEARATFAAAASSCPPNVYAESFAGAGVLSEPGMVVDPANAESPRGGTYAIKITAGDQPGNVTFSNGPSDHGEGRRPVDFSAYDTLELWIKGDAPDVYVKIGHPVFDNKAFEQTHVQSVTSEYSRVTIKIPSPKTDINTLLTIGVPAGKTVYVDDVRAIKGGD
ncbi:MAG TPA: glycosyl hydrolase [Tepidisphaeraceae bacterium]